MVTVMGHLLLIGLSLIRINKSMFFYMTIFHQPVVYQIFLNVICILEYSSIVKKDGIHIYTAFFVLFQLCTKFSL